MLGSPLALVKVILAIGKLDAHHARDGLLALVKFLDAIGKLDAHQVLGALLALVKHLDAIGKLHAHQEHVVSSAPKNQRIGLFVEFHQQHTNWIILTSCTIVLPFNIHRFFFHLCDLSSFRRVKPIIRVVPAFQRRIK